MIFFFIKNDVILFKFYPDILSDMLKTNQI